MGKGGASDVDALRRSLRSAVDQLCDETAAKAPKTFVQELNDSLRTDVTALAARLHAAEAELQNTVKATDVEHMLAKMRAQMDDDLCAVRAECADAVSRVVAIEGRLSACESRLQEHEDIVPRVSEHGERLQRAEISLGEQDARSQQVLASMELLQAKVDKSEHRLEGVETALDKLGASLVDVKSREADLNAELARATAAAAASTPPPTAPPAPTALPVDIEEKLAIVESLDKKLSLLGNLSSEIDQIHTTQREVRHELVLLKRDKGTINNSLADTRQHLNRMQAALEKLNVTIAADVTPFASRLRSLPTALEQFERKLQVMGEWQEGERQSLVAQLNAKADKSVVAPVQKALVMIRDMLFDSGHRKCAAGRAQVSAPPFVCLAWRRFLNLVPLSAFPLIERLCFVCTVSMPCLRPTSERITREPSTHAYRASISTKTKSCCRDNL